MNKENGCPPLKSNKVTLIDYGMGNLASIESALDSLGIAHMRTQKPQEILEAKSLILPGVGAFGKAMENLKSRKLIESLNEAVLKKKTPILGICLGMQLFAESSTEMGNHTGLGWIPGKVDKIKTKTLPLPHVGWNTLEFSKDSILFNRLEKNTHFYFDHTFYFVTDSKNIYGQTQYDLSLTAVVQKDNIYGVQFHPEKSQNAGLKLLRNFTNLSLGGQ